MAELLLSALLPVLFEKLASRELFNFVRQLQDGVDSELNKWKDTMELIQSVLKDAENKEPTDEAVKVWLNKLQDLAYDAEDILDEFAAEALKQKLEADPAHRPSTSKIQRFLPVACFSCVKPKTVKLNMDVKSKIESLTNRFRELCEKRTVLGLQLTPGGRSAAGIAQNRLPSSSVGTERAVYGRNEDKAKILEMVLSDEPSAANFCVIPIVGMGGVGKTTLAREIYNDEAVGKIKFDIKEWICVSDVFDVLSISKTLLTKITATSCAEKDFDKVQVELRKAVEGKKFLLVLDDVWNEDHNLWQTLGAPLMASAPNSKIILTTRHAKVASTMGTIEHYNLKLVSDENCWSIFKMHAFKGRGLDACQILELVREKVIEKCGGLPLAASTLGGLLCSESCDAWDEILNNNIWVLSPQSNILPVLRLSYYYLPAHLKRCFSYCAIFPKDYGFDKEELVLLWMAEGVIRQLDNDMQVEDWGSRCFDDLVSRSIFQQSSTDESKFVMHDFVHDLAQLVSGGTILALEEVNKRSRRFEKVRHASYIRGKFDNKSKFEILNEVDERLRTFLPINIRDGEGTSYITAIVLHDLLPKLKKLRVLSLAGYYISQLPNSVKDLRLLTYLNLTGTMIRKLPESASTLLNLQILILRNCRRLIELPSGLRNLIKLYCLDIKGASSLKEMPSGMKDLKCLHNLSNFIVGKGTGSSLKDLRYLNLLHGEFCISGLENIKDSKEAREAAIQEKLNLEALSLRWSSQFDNSRDEVAEENVLDMLQPYKNIKSLSITCFGGNKLPVWIGDPLFSKMEILELKDCQNCVSLPSLGLLGSLKRLTIAGMKRLKRIGYEIYGNDCLKPFQSLEILNFENLEGWEYWDTDVKEDEHVKLFPLLRELSIKRCPKLSGNLPRSLPLLEKLVVRTCEELVLPVSSFPMLDKLEIDKCKGLQVSNTPIDWELIKATTISSGSVEINGCKGIVYNSPIDDFFPTVTISNFLEFAKFFKRGFQMVDTFRIGDSEQVKTWRQYGVRYVKPAQGLHILTAVDEVSIEENRIGLVSFPEVNLPWHNVRYVRIHKSTAIKSLPEELMGHNSQLERLGIKDCDSLTFIARCKLPPSLQKVEIESCKNLQHMVVDEEEASPSSSSSVSLKYLYVDGCPELTTLSSRLQLLEDLWIIRCPKLELIPDGLHNLKHISILDCPGLVCLLKRGLPNSISSLYIEGCEKLEALPDNMHKLNSLRALDVSALSGRVSFPEEGFPNNLTRLAIGDAEIYKGLIQWGLHRLTSLTSLSIEGCHDAECFPDEETGVMLPTSLTDLIIWKLPKLKYLGFQHLPSLRYLEIFGCPNLTSFPEVGLPSSLLRLEIRGCTNLTSFPEVGLPSSLLRLEISGCTNLTSFPEVGLPSSLLELYIEECPKLKEECKRGKGKEWSKISHIPCVRIDYKFIHDPDEEE